MVIAVPLAGRWLQGQQQHWCLLLCSCIQNRLHQALQAAAGRLAPLSSYV
jgi:hypothetical protein